MWKRHVVLDELLKPFYYVKVLDSVEFKLSKHNIVFKFDLMLNIKI